MEYKESISDEELRKLSLKAQERRWEEDPSFERGIFAVSSKKVKSF